MINTFILCDLFETSWKNKHAANREETFKYCTSTKLQYLFNLTIFTDPRLENVLNLICVKYFEINMKLNPLCKYFKMY